MSVAVLIQTKLKDALNMAIVMRAEGHYADALAYMLNVGQFFDESEPSFLRRFYNGLGITYFGVEQYVLAVEQYEKALAVPVPEDEEEKLRVAAIQGNIANALVELNRLAEAHEYLNDAEVTFRVLGEEAWLGDRLETRARIYFKEGNLRQARASAKEAVNLLTNCFSDESLRAASKTLGMILDACRRAGISEKE